MKISATCLLPGMKIYNPPPKAANRDCISKSCTELSDERLFFIIFQYQGSSSRWPDALPQPWRRLLLYDQRLHGVADARHRVRPQLGLQDPDLRRQL